MALAQMMCEYIIFFFGCICVTASLLDSFAIFFMPIALNEKVDVHLRFLNLKWPTATYLSTILDLRL